MEPERIDSSSRRLVNTFIEKRWYTTTMIIRGQEIDMTETEGFYFREGGDIIGLVTYLVHDQALEITSLDSLRENQGMGCKHQGNKLLPEKGIRYGASIS